MDLRLCEKLSCPRCGPTFPLILLADRVEERRVFDGSLGCPNCRDRYPVKDGFGDLRPEPRRSDIDREPLPEPADDEITRAGALLVGSGGAGRLLLFGRAARFAPHLAGLLGEAHLTAVSASTDAWAEAPGIDRMRAGDAWPFADWSIHGILLDGPADTSWVPEALRVLSPGGRLAVLNAPRDARAALLARGLRVGTPAPDTLLATRGSA